MFDHCSQNMKYDFAIVNVLCTEYSFTKELMRHGGSTQVPTENLPKIPPQAALPCGVASVSLSASSRFAFGPLLSLHKPH